MKFTCEKSLFLSSILTASRAVSSKSSIAALEGILIEAGLNRINVSGYNLKTSISTLIPSEDSNISEKGNIVVNSRLFSEIIRKLPDDEITIFVDENNSSTNLVNIECGNSKYNINGISAEEYPDLPTVESKNSFMINEKVIKEMISQTIFAVSDNDARPIHTGSLFDIENGELTIVSVDGYRLALRKEKIDSDDNLKLKFVVPGNALQEVEKIAADEEKNVEVCLSDKHVMFRFENCILTSRRLEGEFLNYKESIPNNNKYNIGIDRRDIISSVERVALIIDNDLKNPVRFKFNDGYIDVSTNTALGKAYDKCVINGDGEGLEIGFNNKYLLDSLKAAPVDNIVFSMMSGVRPCIITSAEENNNFLYMVLPIKLKAGEN